MAHNSGRELIILNLISDLNNLDCIHSIERKHPVTIEEVESIPSTLLPFVGILGGLPAPIDYKGLSRNQNQISVYSKLAIRLRFIALQEKDADYWISYYLDEVWRAVMSNNNRSNMAEKTEIDSEYISEIFPPYIGFELTINVFYQHTQNGI